MSFTWRAVISKKQLYWTRSPVFCSFCLKWNFLSSRRTKTKPTRGSWEWAIWGPTQELFPVPQCHVAEQKECQGFNVPRLYHSALSLNAAVLVVLTVCCREPTAPLHCPSHRFGFLVTRGWIWAGSSVLRPRGCRHRHTCCCFLWISSTKLTYLNHGLLALLLPSLCPLEANSHISLLLSGEVCMCVCERECVCVSTECVGLHRVFNVHVCIYKPVRALACMCWNTFISHPTSNQWCQPFDACSTVTKPYCTHTTVLHKSQRDREKLHCFSLTSDTFSLQFLAHKMLSSFVPCLKITFVQWTKSRYFVIFKEIYRYIYV